MRPHVPVVMILFAFATGCGPGTTTPTSSAPTPKKNESPPPPCHPGCFPAGTTVLTPAGLREIQTVGKGEAVTIIAADGTATSAAVEAVFETCNRLLDVRTDAGTVRTTETQPLCLAAGGFVEAGRLKAGDRIWKWADGRRVETRVNEVAPVEGTAAVFNLVVGTDKVFVAGGFLARGKPPVQ